MADIFLSYAREDGARARQIADALSAAGHDVFWDVEIPPGMSWADFLEEKLASSKAALVLWSKTSVASQWVREEARLARDRSRLIPVMIEECAPPFGFGEIQAANLTQWRGDANDTNFRLLIGAVERAVGGQPAPRPAPKPDARPLPTPPPPTGFGQAPPPTKKPIPKWAWVAGGVAVIGGLYAIGAEENDGLPNTAPLIAPLATPNDGAVSASVAQVLEQARQIQAEAQAATAQAGQAAAQAQAAAAAARAGSTPGFGVMGQAANNVAGDLATLQRGQPAAVVVQTPTNMFAGTVTADPASGRYLKMVGANQAANGAGSQAVTTFSADVTTGRMVGRYFGANYSAEGSSEGVLASMNMAGLGVVQFSDGVRYAGQYRVAGADGHIVKQGLGAVYNAAGALVQSGRFENDVYAGAN
jgi:hypothetical protein